jgi:hypothetical protein
MAQTYKKRIQLVAISGALLFLCSACDMFAMPDKMDHMSTQTHLDMQDTQRQMEQMRNITEEMKATTTEVLRKGTIGVALQNILDPKNTVYFLPVPANMMPYAQLLADNLTEDEFVKLMDVWARRITQVAASCTDLPGGTCNDATVVADADHEKSAHFWAIAAVSGLMTQEKIEEVVKTEVDSGGQFNETVYQILAARQQFISMVLMDNTLMQKNVDNPGKLKKAVEYANSLQYIAELPFTAKIDFSLMAMLNPDDQIDLPFDATIAPTQWAKIESAFETQLLPVYKDEMSDPDSAEGILLNQLQTEVLSHLPAKGKQAPIKG